MTLSCGKRKPPLPPIERVNQRVEIGGFQQGDKVTLNWTMPARNAPDGSILNRRTINLFHIYQFFLFFPKHESFSF